MTKQPTQTRNDHHGANDPEALWSTDQAAAFLGVKATGLQRWRMEGRGPMYIRVAKTRVMYQRSDLLKWVAANRRQSTSEESALDVAGSDGGEG